MNILSSESDHLTIRGEWISLVNIIPVINNQRLVDAEISRIIQGESAFALQYTSAFLGDGIFILEVVPEDQASCRIRFHVKNFHEPLQSFGVQIDHLENVRSFLRSGYNSWDGSYYVEPENLIDINDFEPRIELGYGMTQLIPRFGLGSTILGFDRHDRFQQIFQFDITNSPISLTINTLWDHKQILPGTSCTSEWLVIFDHPDIEGALRQWANLVAEASQTPPRLNAKPISGWCSWYNLYGYINEENILEHLRSAQLLVKNQNLPLRVFQIDDGFTPEMGDWLDIKPQFPHGMKFLMDEIRNEGFLPGLWIAPFMVGNRSNLFRQHPEWVLHDPLSGQPVTQWRIYGENRWFKRSEEYYILDSTHPEAFDYLRRVFHTWRWEWGCEYFKTDFMLYGTAYGPEQVRYHTPGMTRIESWRKVAEMIRQEIGEAIWLGCGCPLWASVGLVDGIRISGDVGVVWAGGLSAQALLQDLATRNFTNQILWQIDPDCILLREHYHHLSNDEVEALVIYAGMSGGVVMTSEMLNDLPSNRIALIRLILSKSNKQTHYPFLGQSPITYERTTQSRDNRNVQHLPSLLDPVIVQVRRDKNKNLAAIFLLNTGSRPVQRSIPLENLGLIGPLYLYVWKKGIETKEPEWQIQVKLESHQGVLFFASRDPLLQMPDTLP